MKIALISNQETQQGRSSFAILLATLFSLTQHRKSVIFSTGKMNSLLSYVGKTPNEDSSKTVSVMASFIENGIVFGDEVYDYATRIGEGETYLFDIFNSTMDEEDLKKLFLAFIQKVKADMVLVEIKGSPEEEWNKEVIKNCDVVLNIFNHNKRCMDALLDFMHNFDISITSRMGIVCSKFDPNVIGEKKLSQLIEMKPRNIMEFPYNSVIGKAAIDGNMDRLAYKIAQGHNELVNLRSKLLEIMQYLFDDAHVKYIKGVNEWYK